MGRELSALLVRPSASARGRTSDRVASDEGRRVPNGRAPERSRAGHDRPDRGPAWIAHRCFSTFPLAYLVRSDVVGWMPLTSRACRRDVPDERYRRGYRVDWRRARSRIPASMVARQRGIYRVRRQWSPIILRISRHSSYVQNYSLFSLAALGAFISCWVSTENKRKSSKWSLKR